MKSVTFDFSKNTLHETYHNDDYDRGAYMLTLWQRCRKEITDEQWRDMFVELNNYKMTEMTVHINSIDYTKIHYF
jgi:hypothetical protein